MTQPGTTEVAVDMLIRNARRRYEDSYAYHALYQFVLDVAAIPRWAWSDLPWSDEWRRGWETASAHRADEARDIRDRMTVTGGRLFQVAANYTDTDLEVALTFHRVDPDSGVAKPTLDDPDVGVYLDHYRRDGDEVRARSGGMPPEPEFPERPPAPATDASGRPVFPSDDPTPPSGVPYPDEHERLQPLLQEEPPAGHGTWMSTDDAGDTVGGHTFSAQENDRLQEFVEEFGPDLHVMEKEALAADPSAPRPWTQMVEPAWLSCPSVIEQRATLMFSVGNSYSDLHHNLEADTRTLAEWWSGNAAGTYVVYAQSLVTHLARLTEQANTLGQEGIEAARVLSKLRTAYAEVGYRYIDLLMQRYEDFLASTAETVGRVAGCASSPEGAISAFANAMADYYKALWDERRKKAEEAQALLAPERIAADGPEFGPRLDRVTPATPLAGYDVWGDVSRWHP